MRTQSPSATAWQELRLRVWSFVYIVASLIHLALPDFIVNEWWGPAFFIIVGCAAIALNYSCLGFVLNVFAHVWTLFFLRDVLTQSALLLLFSLLGAYGCYRHTSRILSTMVWISALTYVVAAIHKLNSGFFDLEQSCAVHALNQVSTQWLLPIPKRLLNFAPMVTICVELGLGVLLLLKSRWFWMLAIAFHVPLVVTLAPAFGAVMLCGAWASISARELAVMRRFFESHKQRLLLFSVSAMALQMWMSQNDLSPTQHLQVGGYVLIGYLGFRCHLPSNFDGQGWIGGLLWLLFCLTPYLGIQYQHTAAMLSNLRIDQGCHNSYVFSPNLITVDPYIRIEKARFGVHGFEDREKILRDGLWNPAALFTMQRNWCATWVRPIELMLTYEGNVHRLPDLCESDALTFFSSYQHVFAELQRFQKNLVRECNQTCIH